MFEVAAGSLIWLSNLYHLPSHLQHTDTLDVVTSVMILFLCPPLVWNAATRAK